MATDKREREVLKKLQTVQKLKQQAQQDVPEDDDEEDDDEEQFALPAKLLALAGIESDEDFDDLDNEKD